MLTGKEIFVVSVVLHSKSHSAGIRKYIFNRNKLRWKGNRSFTSLKSAEQVVVCLFLLLLVLLLFSIYSDAAY